MLLTRWDWGGLGGGGSKLHVGQTRIRGDPREIGRTCFLSFDRYGGGGGTLNSAVGSAGFSGFRDFFQGLWLGLVVLVGGFFGDFAILTRPN